MRDLSTPEQGSPYSDTTTTYRPNQITAGADDCTNGNPPISGGFNVLDVPQSRALGLGLFGSYLTVDTWRVALHNSTKSWCGSSKFQAHAVYATFN